MPARPPEHARPSARGLSRLEYRWRSRHGRARRDRRPARAGGAMPAPAARARPTSIRRDSSGGTPPSHGRTLRRSHRPRRRRARPRVQGSARPYERRRRRRSPPGRPRAVRRAEGPREGQGSLENRRRATVFPPERAAAGDGEPVSCPCSLLVRRARARGDSEACSRWCRRSRPVRPAHRAPPASRRSVQLGPHPLQGFCKSRINKWRNQPSSPSNSARSGRMSLRLTSAMSRAVTCGSSGAST